MELFPNYQPDPIQDPPDFVAMVNEVRAEIDRDLAAEETQVDEVPSTSDEAPPVTQPANDPVQEPVAEAAKKKKKGAGRFVLIGAGVAVAVGAALLISGPDPDPDPSGGVEISEPPPLPN